MIMIAIIVMLASVAAASAQDIPAYDVNSYCRPQDLKVLTSYCIASERKRLEEIGKRWPAVPTSTKEYCIRRSMPVGTYDTLKRCLDEERAMSPPSLRFHLIRHGVDSRLATGHESLFECILARDELPDPHAASCINR